MFFLTSRRRVLSFEDGGAEPRDWITLLDSPNSKAIQTRNGVAVNWFVALRIADQCSDFANSG